MEISNVKVTVFIEQCFSNLFNLDLLEDMILTYRWNRSRGSESKKRYALFRDSANGKHWFTPTDYADHAEDPEWCATFTSGQFVTLMRMMVEKLIV